MVGMHLEFVRIRAECGLEATGIGQPLWPGFEEVGTVGSEITGPGLRPTADPCDGTLQSCIAGAGLGAERKSAVRRLALKYKNMLTNESRNCP